MIAIRIGHITVGTKGVALLVLLLATFFLSGYFGTRIAAEGGSDVLSACANQNHLRLVDEDDSCKSNETFLQWNVEGIAGLPGRDGINCWDLNENGHRDLDEDINNDGTIDVLDCRADVEEPPPPPPPPPPLPELRSASSTVLFDNDGGFQSFTLEPGLGDANLDGEVNHLDFDVQSGPDGTDVNHLFFVAPVDNPSGFVTIGLRSGVSPADLPGGASVETVLIIFYQVEVP